MLKLFAGRTTPQKVFEETIYLIKPIKSSAFVGFFILLIMKEIQLTQGKVALVDDEDFEYLNQFKWQAKKTHSNNYYAGRWLRLSKGIRIFITMQNEIIKPCKNFIVDHVNNIGIDNRKINLRVCNNLENMRNKNIYKNNSSGFKGVSWDKKRKKYYSYIRHNNLMYNLGHYIDPKDAARAYNEAAIKYHGEFANLNKID